MIRDFLLGRPGELPDMADLLGPASHPPALNAALEDLDRGEYESYEQAVAGAAATVGPWFVKKVSATKVTVEPATVQPGNVMPTIGGTALDAATPPELTITGSGTEYVIATFNWTPSFDSDGVVIEGDSTLDSVVITAGSSLTPDDYGAGTYRRKVVTFVDGAKTAQVMNHSMDADLLNKGEFDSEARMVAMASG